MHTCAVTIKILPVFFSSFLFLRTVNRPHDAIGITAYIIFERAKVSPPCFPFLLLLLLRFAPTLSAGVPATRSLGTIANTFTYLVFENANETKLELC